jgi:hypothetical protein
MGGWAQLGSAAPHGGARARRLHIFALFALSCAVFAGVAVQSSIADESIRRLALHRPFEVQADGYVSSSACRSCHPSQYASWSNSYHRRMTQLATPESVLGPFEQIELGQSPHYRLERREDQFYVNVAAQRGEPEQRYPITLLTGSHHMQIYWYETGSGRKLAQLPFVYLNADRRWVPRNDIFIEPPVALRPNADGRWNASCIACHTTHGEPRLDADGMFDTRVAEFGIACEACHGPAEQHVAENRSPVARYRKYLSGSGDASIVQPKKLDHQRASFVCGQCHGVWLHDGPEGMRRWNEHGFAYRPGDDLRDSMLLLQPSRAAEDARVAEVVANEASILAGQFWSDGVMRVSGREFNGMVDSPCYARGELSCMSCHTLHQTAHDGRPAQVWADDQLSVGMDGDRGCLQCHAQFSGKLTAHTHHAPESEGSRCYNCHMPHTSYGLLKALRSHRIDVPSVASTVQTGRPNACNLCHLDKSLGWTAHWLRERYGIESPALDADQQNVAAALWLGLTGDAGQRALIAWAAGWRPAQQASNHTFMPLLLGTLMDDPYDAVRYIAQRALHSLPDVDARDLTYDFVQRPSEREPVADRVAGLARSQPSAAEQTELRALFARLQPRRDDRDVHLLE